MKKYHILFVILCIFFVGNAQYETPDISKLHPKRSTRTHTQKNHSDKKTATTTEQTKVPEIDSAAKARFEVSDAGYQLLCSAVENAFIVVKQSYNVRKDGANISGNSFFGQCYSVLPILQYGYGIDSRYRQPWVLDNKAANYASDQNCIFTVDDSQYKRFGEKSFKPFNLTTTIADTLASNIFFVRDSFMNNNGLQVGLGNGIQKGYMVWFYDRGNDKIEYSILPMTLTYNENFIFPIEQPKNPEQTVGGMFIRLNADTPGTISIELLGIARIEPYSKDKWELVKFLKAPKNLKNADSAVTKEEDSSSDKDSKQKNGENESIVPDKNTSKNHSSKEDSKKGKNTNSDKKSK